MSVPAVARGLVRLALKQLAQSQTVQTVLPSVRGVRNRPAQERAAMMKLCLVTASSLYVGGLIAHKGASYLEENEIFVPSEDDDDD